MKRIGSESKMPGMKASREWPSPDNLSAKARAVGAQRRREREEAERLISQIDNLTVLLRNIERQARRKLK